MNEDKTDDTQAAPEGIKAPEGCETLRLPEVISLRLQLAYEKAVNAANVAQVREAELNSLLQQIGAEAVEGGAYELHSIDARSGVLFRKPAGENGAEKPKRSRRPSKPRKARTKVSKKAN